MVNALLLLLLLLLFTITYNLHTGDLKLAYMLQITMSLRYIIERYSLITIHVAYIYIYYYYYYLLC
jgi:hypothetical protein